MSGRAVQKIADIITRNEKELLELWMREQLAAVTLRPDLMKETELRRQSQEFLTLLRGAVQKGDVSDIRAPGWAETRDFLDDLSRSRAEQGFTPSETAIFVFSMKQPLFAALQKEVGADPKELGEHLWMVTALLDKLGLYTAEAFLKGREEIIRRQQQDLLELSTPVVQLWEGVLALPLIGTLDSTRTRVVMQALLQRIADTGSTIAIIDITGVPTVDTLVAQHLLRTVSAARLMGADCIISGIRPVIAQAIIHLGVALTDVVTKASLSDALAAAFSRLGLQVSRRS